MLNLDKSTYLNESIIEDYISIDNNLQPIKKPLSLVANLQIDNTRFVNTTPLTSNEGQVLTNIMLVIEYSSKLYLKYIPDDTSDSNSNNIFLLSFSKVLNICCLPLPDLINDIDIITIINNKRFTLSYDILNIDFECIDNKTLYYNISTIFKFSPLI